MNRCLKRFLHGCINGLLVVIAVGLFILGVYLIFSALEYRTWDYIVGFIIYVIILFGSASVVD